MLPDAYVNIEPRPETKQRWVEGLGHAVDSIARLTSAPEAKNGKEWMRLHGGLPSCNQTWFAGK